MTRVHHDVYFTAGLDADPELAEAIRGEIRRQQNGIELIASESIVSRLVLEAQGSVLTNKTVEGLPHHRYYGGAKYADAIEALAVKRACEVFGFDEIRDLALQNRPRLIVAGGSAYPRAIDFAGLRAIADEVDAYLMVDMAHFAGLVATGHYPDPLPYADVVTTTTYKSLRGARGGLVLWNDEGLSKKINAGTLTPV